MATTCAARAARAPVIAPAPGPISITVRLERSPKRRNDAFDGLRIVEEVLSEPGFGGHALLLMVDERRAATQFHRVTLFNTHINFGV
jgi:hypothetical protein